MKKIVFIFLILFSNSSFGDKLDDFIQHLNQSIDQINSMHSKLQNHLFFLTLKDNEKAQNACIKYFGKFDVTEKEVGQLKDIFAFIEFIKSIMIVKKIKSCDRQNRISICYYVSKKEISPTFTKENFPFSTFTIVRLQFGTVSP